MRQYELHKRIGYKVSRLSRTMQARLERDIAKFGISRLMWCVLTGVGDENVSNPSELADYVGITRPAMSRLLRDMEGKGLVERSGGNGDGRTIEIRLNSLGKDTLERARSTVDALNRHFSSKLSPERLAEFMLAVDLLGSDEHERLTKL